MAKSNVAKVVASTSPTILKTPVAKKVQQNIQTIIFGRNVEVEENIDTNYPEWFWYVIIAGCIVCCVSCLAWMVCALFFFKKERKCTHTAQIIVVHEDAKSPSKPTRSPKKEEDGTPQNNHPLGPSEDQNGSFTNPLDPDGGGAKDAGYARSSKRSSRKEAENGGGAPDGNSKKSISSIKNSSGKSKNGSKKSVKSGKSGKSDRNEGGKEEVVIRMNDGMEEQKLGFFGKMRRSMFNSRAN